MKTIEYTASYIYRDGDSAAGEPGPDVTISVQASNIGTGMTKAVRAAQQNGPDWLWLYKVEFSRVAA